MVGTMMQQKIALALIGFIALCILVAVVQGSPRRAYLRRLRRADEDMIFPTRTQPICQVCGKTMTTCCLDCCAIKTRPNTTADPQDVCLFDVRSDGTELVYSVRGAAAAFLRQLAVAQGIESDIVLQQAIEAWARTALPFDEFRDLFPLR